MSKAGKAVDEVVAPRRRQRWTEQEKQRIVEEAMAPGASIAQVARERGVNANQLHCWRRLYERGALGGEAGRTTLLPVRVIADRAGSLPVVRLSNSSAMTAPAHQARRQRSTGIIEVELERGRLRIEGAADPAALRVVLESLLG